jgi:hypothetical protein
MRAGTRSIDVSRTAEWEKHRLPDRTRASALQESAGHAVPPDSPWPIDLSPMELQAAGKATRIDAISVTTRLHERRFLMWQSSKAAGRGPVTCAFEYKRRPVVATSRPAKLPTSPAAQQTRVARKSRLGTVAFEPLQIDICCGSAERHAIAVPRHCRMVDLGIDMMRNTGRTEPPKPSF